MNPARMLCRIRAESQATRVDVFDEIGGGQFGAISAQDFAGELAGVKGALEVHINSGGGEVFDGLAIYETLRSHPGPVTTVVDGLAASIASVIFQAGGKRVVKPAAALMVHDAWGSADGPAADMQSMAATLDKVSDIIAGVYASRAGGSKTSWRNAMKESTWFDADEAVAANLADQVGGGRARPPDGLDLAALAVPGRIAAQLRNAAAESDGGGDGGDAAPACKTCGGKGRLKHPGTGKASIKCPGCNGTGRYDPDSDGDDDSTAAGDTDHDYVSPDGHAVGLTADDIRAIIREELRDAASVDSSAWDGGKAMASGAASSDPAKFYAAICAGRRAGDPSKQSSWALPYRYTPSSAPNAAAVRNALARLPQTQGLVNKAAAQALLDRLMKQISPDHEPANAAGPDLRALLEGADVLSTLKEAFE